MSQPQESERKSNPENAQPACLPSGICEAPCKGCCLGSREQKASMLFGIILISNDAIIKRELSLLTLKVFFFLSREAFPWLLLWRFIIQSSPLMLHEGLSSLPVIYTLQAVPKHFRRAVDMEVWCSVCLFVYFCRFHFHIVQRAFLSLRDFPVDLLFLRIYMYVCACICTHACDYIYN